MHPSDNSHPRVPPRSARDRITTSCGECRRRKQKCSQGQPCANCLRRFPQPVCEYKPNRRRNPPGVSSHPTFTVAIRPTADSEPSTRDTPGRPPRPRLPRHLDLGRTGLEHGGEVAMWSGVNMATQYPSAVSLDRLVNFSSHATPPHILEDVTECDENCTRHSQLVHDAVHIIVHRVSIPDRYLCPPSSASPSDVHQVMAFHVAVNSGSGTWNGVGDDFDTLPMVHSKQNGDLLKIFLKLLSRYKTSLDGNPSPSDPIVKSYLPYCIQNPLLLQITLYTSACFLNETGHMPKTTVMAHKGKAIYMLNERLRSQSHQTDDAVIAGVIQLILDEWYWGDTDDLHEHMRGLREMIRIRGGFQDLGMDGLLAKMVIAYDVGIAVAHETKPFLGNDTGFDYEDRRAVPYRVSHNTPLVNNLPAFSTSAEALGLHPTAAWILDNVRFITNAVLSLPEDASPEQLKKIAETSNWIYEQISSLPADSPEGRVVDESNLNFPANVINADGAAVPLPDRAAAAEHALNSGSRNAPEPHTEWGARESAPYREQTDDTALTRVKCSLPSEFQDVAARPDFIYRVVRVAALVTVRAIRDRLPFSAVCTVEEFLQIWTTSWRVPLTTWRGMIGIFNWATVSIVPLSHGGAHERFARTMFMISMVSRAVEDWGVFMAASTGAMRLQSWLAGGLGRGKDKVSAGGAMVEKHGFVNSGWE